MTKSPAYKAAIAKILAHYPEKDLAWAEQQLDRALENSEGYSYNDILEFEFDITEY